MSFELIPIPILIWNVEKGYYFSFLNLLFVLTFFVTFLLFVFVHLLHFPIYFCYFQRDEVNWSNNVLSKFIFSFECRSFEKRCFCTFFQISVLSKKLNFERMLIDQTNWTIYTLKNICLIVLSKIYLFICSKNNLLTFLT